jgi:hypothetical protein
VGVDVAQAVVAAGTAALLHPHAPRCDIEFVVEHDHAIQRHLQEAHRLAHGLG